MLKLDIIEGVKGQWEGLLSLLWCLMDSQLMRSLWSHGLELWSWSLAGKRNEDVSVLVPMLSTVEGAAPLPCAMSLCAPVPSVSSQAFLPLLKKAAQGSPGSGLSCSKAAIVNISSIGGSIACSYGWEQMQVVSYRCSKVLSHLCFPCPAQP